MTASAPITQDVMTLPRKEPEGGKINLVGLTREQLQQVAQYRIGAKQGVLTESGGFRLLTGPCAPTEQVAEAG